MAWDGSSEEEPESKCGWAAILMLHASRAEQGRRLMHDVDEQSVIGNPVQFGQRNRPISRVLRPQTPHWRNAERGA